MTRVGVLALQGDFAEHIGLLQSLEVEGTEVRLARDLDKVEKHAILGTILSLSETTFSTISSSRVKKR